MGPRSILSFKTGSVLGVLAFICASVGQQPGLRLSALGTNQLLVLITNASATTNYSLERRSLLDSSQSWAPYFRGAVGQSNFTVFSGADSAGFLRGRPGIDWTSNYLAWSAPLPPLALNTFWDTYLGNFRVSEDFVRTNAQFAATNGLLAAGWNIIWLDDGWQADTRDSSGNLQPSTNFPAGMGALTSYLHQLGFRAGIYTGFDPNTCEGYPGTDIAHVDQDIRQFASWGFDALTVDICSPVLSTNYVRELCRVFDNAIIQLPFTVGRTNPLIFCTSWLSPLGELPPFIPFEANMWFDGQPPMPFSSISNGMYLANYQNQTGWRSNSGPGHYADFISPSVTDTNLAAAQLCLQMILASGQHGLSFFSSGMGVTDPMSYFQYFTNAEIMALNNDPACIPGIMVASNSTLTEIWVRPLGSLTSGTNAVLLSNFSGTNVSVDVCWTNLFGTRSNSAVRPRDLQLRADLPLFTNVLSTIVPPNRVKLYRFDMQ